MAKPKPKAIIVDMDGTLSSSAHRAHFVTNKPADWSSFHGHMVQDQPIPQMVKLLKQHDMAGHTIVVLTLRPERMRKHIEDWLDRYDIPFDEMYLRPEGNYERGDVVKHDIISKDIMPEFDVVAAYDDNNTILDMERELGLKTFKITDPALPPDESIDPIEDSKHSFNDKMELEFISRRGYRTPEDIPVLERAGAEIWVPPYVRVNEFGDVENVDGYWRKLSAAQERLMALVHSAGGNRSL